MNKESRIAFVLGACLFGLFLLTSCSNKEATSTGGVATSVVEQTPLPTAVPQPRRLIGYYTSWSIYGRKYQVEDVPGDKLTHINYAFANIADGECILGDSYADLGSNFTGLQKLKEKHPHLQTLLSVGGWTWSRNFSDAAVSAESREKFALSCLALMEKGGFDGLDLDWEYPVEGGSDTMIHRPEDTANLTSLLQLLRQKLDAKGEKEGRPYLLTIAAPAGEDHYKHFALAEIHPYLDWINVMSYDYYGAWSLEETNFLAPLYPTNRDVEAASSFQPPKNIPERGKNVYDTLVAYLQAGVPPYKLVMGVPFYGRGWGGVSAEYNGLYQPAGSRPRGTWEPGIYDYYDIVENYNSETGYTRYWNELARVPWLYNPETKIMITYEDPQSMTEKVNLVKQFGLAGIMFWELSGDVRDPNSADSLLNTIHSTLFSTP